MKGKKNKPKKTGKPDNKKKTSTTTTKKDLPPGKPTGG